MTHTQVKSEYKKRPVVYKRREPEYKHLPAVYTTHSVKPVPKQVYKRKLALLLPAHNEELIIKATIQSAIAAGQPKADIYVVDDNSTDRTRQKAINIIGKKKVLTVSRSGKALAVYQAIQYFEIEKRYTWVHVADSDSVFGQDYFRIYRRNLSGKKYAAAVGFVQSLRGNWISKYRAFSYTYGQHIIRRMQSWAGMISVMPGPITCFRTDIIKHLDFAGESLTEDFDITLQIHRKKLGGIKFIPGAVNFTQDPQTLRDFCNQTARWQRGFFQGVIKYRVGFKRQMIDASIGYQMLQLLFYLFELGFLVPYIIITTGRWIIIPLIIISDFVVLAWLALFSATVAKRLSILSALPYFYFLRWLELGIFLKAFVEVVILKKFRDEIKGWQTEGRRYALDADALQDTAKV
jgi:cellulose synthase/poly-beta-1,6-N-acetylglucosamine synthase-like glycosyltransferase